MLDQIGPDPCGLNGPARIEPAVAVAHAGFGLFGFGVAQKHQSHVNSIDFFGAAYSGFTLSGGRNRFSFLAMSHFSDGKPESTPDRAGGMLFLKTF
jgi:hypothetical protein